LLKVLLIDDEKDMLRLLQKYFERKGFYVSAYSNPLFALDEFMKNKNNDNDNYYVI
jgi:DNA-binding response OmpR family regulator